MFRYLTCIQIKNIRDKSSICNWQLLNILQNLTFMKQINCDLPLSYPGKFSSYSLIIVISSYKAVTTLPTSSASRSFRASSYNYFWPSVKKVKLGHYYLYVQSKVNSCNNNKFLILMVLNEGRSSFRKIGL